MKTSTEQLGVSIDASSRCNQIVNDSEISVSLRSRYVWTPEDSDFKTTTVDFLIDEMRITVEQVEIIGRRIYVRPVGQHNIEVVIAKLRERLPNCKIEHRENKVSQTE